MRKEAQFHIQEAQKQLRLALKYASEFDDCGQLSKMTEILGYFDSWITDEPKIKHELNNTKFKWDNEYRFVPATQKQESMVLCDGYSVKNDEL